MVEINSMIILAIVATIVTLVAINIFLKSTSQKKEDAKYDANSDLDLDANTTKQTASKNKKSKAKKSKSSDNLEEINNAKATSSDLSETKADKKSSSKKNKKTNKTKKTIELMDSSANDNEDDDDVPIVQVVKPAPKPVAPKHQPTHIHEDELAARALSEAIAKEDARNFNLQKVDDWAVVEIKKSAKLKKQLNSHSPEEDVKIVATTSVTTTTAAVAVKKEVEIIVEEVFAPAVPQEPVDFFTDSIVIPAAKLGAIIGTKGAVKISIQNASGAELTFPKTTKESKEPVTITITGPKESVKKAKKAVQDLISKGYSVLLEGEEFREAQVNVPVKFLADIIGKGGVNIRRMQEQLTVRVNIPQIPTPEPGEPVKPNVKIIVTGLKDNVMKCKQVIKELIEYHHTEITHPGYIHEELDIPSNFYNHIIGSKGSEIKHIQANFKVTVHIPNADSVSSNVVVVGLPAQVDAAKKYILKIVETQIHGQIHGFPRKGKNQPDETLPIDENDVDIAPGDEVIEMHHNSVSISDILSSASAAGGTWGKQDVSGTTFDY